MDRQAMAEHVRELRVTAARFVRRHAAIYAKDVPRAEVDAICTALGDITIDEATDALDRRRRQGEIGAALPLAPPSA